MTENFIEILFRIILIADISVLLVSLINLVSAPILKNIFVASDYTPRVSILIPARNEEENIYHAVKSVLEQSYKNFELIVLDDNSTDNTLARLTEFSKYDNRLKVISGKQLPPEWLGKNFACHQLAEQANGEIFLFIDADVTLAKNTIVESINILNDSQLDMLSIFPSQNFSGFGARLIIPMMNWVLLAFLPLIAVSRVKLPVFSAANGQFIMIKKNVYDNIGGHNSVKKEIVEDMALARLLKSDGYKIQTALGGDAVYCNMYNTFRESVNGFSKNFFPGFGLPAPLFIILLLTFMFLFLLPLALITFPGFDIIAGIILLQRIFISIISKQNILQNVVLHPLQMFALVYTGFVSLYKNLTGKVQWKERKI